MQAQVESFYLWAWANPRPDETIESIIIEPNDRKFLLAAITLGHADEWPFNRQGRREIKITLPNTADAEKPFNLEVDVDRGTATYPYALPEAEAGAFISADFKGWGEPQNQKSSPAFVEIGAIPSATVTVRQDGEAVGTVNWGDLQARGAVESARVRLEVVDTGRNWVHVTVLDDQTAQPVPCRVHFRSSHGIPYQPHGHHNHVNSNMDSWHQDIGGDLWLGQMTYAYIDGRCDALLWIKRTKVQRSFYSTHEEPTSTLCCTDPSGLARCKILIAALWSLSSERPQAHATQRSLSVKPSKIAPQLEQVLDV